MAGKVEITDIAPLPDSIYLKPKRIHYTENGVEKSWDVVEVHDSVAVLLYHKEEDALLLVKQVRPAIFMKNQDGVTYELCAGIIDKKLSHTKIAHEEIEEETGFLVPVEQIERVTEFYTSVGFAGSRQELFFAVIDESMKVHEGGGVHGEMIELFYLKREQIEAFMFDESRIKTPGLLFALQWFACKKQPTL